MAKGGSPGEGGDEHVLRIRGRRRRRGPPPREGAGGQSKKTLPLPPAVDRKSSMEDRGVVKADEGAVAKTEDEGLAVVVTVGGLKVGPPMLRVGDDVGVDVTDMSLITLLGQCLSFGCRLLNGIIPRIHQSFRFEMDPPKRSDLPMATRGSFKQRDDDGTFGDGPDQRAAGI